jgi:Fe2+ transport system protein FeoA
MSTPSHQSSLWSLSSGESAVIHDFGSSEIDVATRRLMDIGFRAGQRVTCLMTPGFGAPRVYAVGGATYSLDRATAERIRTREPSV